MREKETNKRSKKNIIIRWLQIIVIIYCAIGIALYYLQEKFLFHPVKLEPSHNFNFNIPFEELMIPLNNCDSISMVKFLPATDKKKGVVIYFHGNRQNIERYAKYAVLFTRNGYEVWMPDYPGFGKSTGERTEKKLYQLGLQVQKIAATKYGSDSIIIYGKSLGTGIAAYTASVTNCKALILETPYYSIPSLFSTYAFIYPTSKMSNYKIPTFEFLKDVKAPVTIFHGTDDEVIPLRNSVKLKNSFKTTDSFIEIINGKHNNLIEFSSFIISLDSILH